MSGIDSTLPLAAGTEFDCWQMDPIGFHREVLGREPWGAQARILEAVRDHPRTAVRSCHGAGKSWTAAGVVVHFLRCFPGSLAVTTAPTARQVKNILWKEIALALRGARVPLGGRQLMMEWHLGPGWFGFGFATQVPDNFQGLHAERILVVVDEAPGIPPDIWAAIDGILTTADARLLAIGNPTEAQGPFYDLYHTHAPGVHKLAISAYDTPNLTHFGITEADIAAGTWQEKLTGPLPAPWLVTPDWVADKYRRWGPSSALYQSRVLGDFPEEGTDTLIRLSWVEAARARILPPTSPVEVAVDVARFGDDFTVIGIRRGPQLTIHTVTHKEDTMATTGRVVGAMDEIRRSAAFAQGPGPEFGDATDTLRLRAKVDVVGIGAGVVDRLVELREPVVAMNAGEAARDPERFVNRRAEWYWALRERLQDGDISLPADDELVAQLTSMKYRFDSRGRIYIESKDDMKKRGLPSPDKADMAMLAFADEAPMAIRHHRVGRSRETANPDW